jgi:sensor histidine kinase regulating citrate/malate metabolism
VKQPKRTLSLRTRVTLFLSLTALVASMSLTLLTYTAARNYLLSQRSAVARAQTFANAKAARDELRLPRPDLSRFITSIRTDDTGFALLNVGDRSYPQTWSARCSTVEPVNRVLNSMESRTLPWG